MRGSRAEAEGATAKGRTQGNQQKKHRNASSRAALGEKARKREGAPRKRKRKRKKARGRWVQPSHLRHGDTKADGAPKQKGGETG